MNTKRVLLSLLSALLIVATAGCKGRVFSSLLEKSPLKDVLILTLLRVSDIKVKQITSTSVNKTYGIGSTVNIKVTFTDNVIINSGTIDVTLNTGETVQLVPENYNEPIISLEKSFTVDEGETSRGSKLNAVSIVKNGQIVDNDGLPVILSIPVYNSELDTGNIADFKSIYIDGVRPRLVSITTESSDGLYGSGTDITIKLIFSELVELHPSPGGSFTITLTSENSGSPVTMNITSLPMSASRTYTYHVNNGDTSNGNDLDVVSIAMNGASVIRDTAQNAMEDFSIPAGNNLADNSNIIVNGIQPTITSIYSTSPDGRYGIGADVNVTVTFSEPVTLSGGTLDVTLDTGEVVHIAPFGPSSTASGTYTVQSGQTSADLNATNVELSGGTLKNGIGNDALMALPGTRFTSNDIVIDGVRPTITSVTSSTANGTYGTGANVNVHIVFSEQVNLSGGTLDVTLNTGDVLNITAFGPATSVDATYIVSNGDTTSGSDLTVTNVALGGGASLRDTCDYSPNNITSFAIGTNLAANKDIIIDAVSPTITNITSSTANGTYGTGQNVNLTITFSKSVTLSSGYLRVTLNATNGGTPKYVDIIPTDISGNTATKTYTVASNDTTSGADLDISNIELFGGTLKDAYGNDANLSLPSGQNLADNKDIKIDGIAPSIASINSTTANGTYGVNANINVTIYFSEAVTLTGANGMDVTLNTGDVINVPAFGPAASVTLNYSVSNGDTTSGADLTVTNIALGSGSTLRDVGGNNADLTLPVGQNLADNKDIKVDGVVPVITAITSTSSDGTYGIGGSIVVKINFNKAVTLTGANGMNVTLNSGKVLTIPAFGPAATVEETYVVASGETTSGADLTVTNIALGSGSTLRDSVNNDADLSLPSGQNLADNKDIKVDGIRPLISSVSSSTANGTYGTGANVNVTITFTEPVTLTAGTLDVTLNSGYVLNISPFGTSNTASGTYTVASGNTTSGADLTAGAVSVSGGVIVDNAGNTMTDFSVPTGQNIADLKDIIIDAVPPAIVSAETLDADGDGRIDHYRLTFNKNVKDSSFPGYVENSVGNAQSHWLVAGYSGVKLAHGSAAPESDTPNDTVIYVIFNEISSGYDTDAKPDLTTTATPGLTDTVANSPNPLSQIGTATVVETDKARPAIVSASGITGTTGLTITFSEPVDGNGSTGGCNANLETADFAYVDGNGSGATGISSMGGDGDACSDRNVSVTLNSNLAIADLNVDAVHAVANSIYDMADNIANASLNVAVSGAISPYVLGVTATGARKIRVTFSEPVDNSTGATGARNLSNYTLIEDPVESGCSGSGSDTVNLTGTVTEITPGEVFELSTDSDQCSSTTYRLTVANVVDVNDGVPLVDPKFATFLGNERLKVASASCLTATSMMVVFNKAVEYGANTGSAEVTSRYKFTGPSNLGSITGASRGTGGNTNRVTLTHTVEQTGSNFTVIASNAIDGDGFNDAAYGAIETEDNTESLQSAPRDRWAWAGCGDPISQFDQGPIATDPFGDGSDFGYLAAYNSRVYIGPNNNGNMATRMEADGSNPTSVFFTFPEDTTGDTMYNTATNIVTIGHTGCQKNSNDQNLGCGPDNENGRGVFNVGSLQSSEVLFIGGARTEAIGGNYFYDYIYYTTDTDTNLNYLYIDMGTITGTITQSLSSITTLNNRIFAGMAKINYYPAPYPPDPTASGRNAPDFGKINFSSGSPEQDCTFGQSCDATDGTRGLRFFINCMPYFGGTDQYGDSSQNATNNYGYYVGVDSVFVYRGRIYAGNGGYNQVNHNGGVIRSDGDNYANPGACEYTSSCGACNDWVEITPRGHTAWHNSPTNNRHSIELTKVADLIPRDKGIPGFAEYNNNLYMIRNACQVANGNRSYVSDAASNITGCTAYSGDYTSKRQPQLWRCVPNTTGDPDECEAGDWSLIDSNADGMTKMGDAHNHSLTMIVRNGSYLYVGFDNLNDGVSIYRTNAANPTENDFTLIGTQGLGNPTNIKEIYSAISIQSGADYYIYVSAGKNLTPVSVYRQKNN